MSPWISWKIFAVNNDRNEAEKAILRPEYPLASRYLVINIAQSKSDWLQISHNTTPPRTIQIVDLYLNK